MSLNNLIIIKDPYKWIGHMYHIIVGSRDKFEILILGIDSSIPIMGYDKLCENAIYEQRRYDLFCMGKKLNIRKISNLNLNENKIDIRRLIMQIQMLIMFRGIKNVYYQSRSYSYKLLEIATILNSISNKLGTKIHKIEDLKFSENIVKDFSVGLPKGVI